MSALESSTEPIEIDDLDGSIVFTNEAWEQLFGYDKSDVLRAKWETLQFGSAEPREMKASWAQCIALGHSEGLFHVTLMGNTDLVILYTRSLHKDADGASTAVITRYMPLTGTMMASEVDALLTALIEEVSDAVAMLDANGFVVRGNHLFAGLSGYETSEIDGMHIQAFFPDVHGGILSEKPRGFVGQTRMIHRDGGTASVWSNVTPIGRSRQKVVGFLVLARSVEQSREVDSERADAVQSGRYEHEMRNVLTAIVNTVELIHMTISDEALRRRLTYIRSAVARGIEILEDMRRGSGR